MIASILIVFFILLVPGHFKKMGLQMLLDEKKGALFFIHFSKLIYWACFIFIITLWINPTFVPYVWIGLPVILAFRVFMEHRKHNPLHLFPLQAKKQGN